MNIIEEYRKVTEELAVAKSNLKRVNRAIVKLINNNAPKDITGTCYSDIKIQNNVNILDLAEALYQRDKFLSDRNEAEKEYEDLSRQLEELEETINSLGDINKKVLMLRIKGYTNWQIADKLHYSVRRIEQIVAESKKKIKKEL